VHDIKTDFSKILEFVWREQEKTENLLSTIRLTFRRNTSRRQRAGHSHKEHKHKPQWLQDLQTKELPTRILTSIIELLLVTQEYDLDLCVALAGGIRLLLVHD